MDYFGEVWFWVVFYVVGNVINYVEVNVWNNFIYIIGLLCYLIRIMRKYVFILM